MLPSLIFGIWIHICDYQMPVCLNCISGCTQAVVKNFCRIFFLLAIFRRFSIEIVSICELKIFAIFRCSIFSCFVSWNGNKKLFQTWYETLISVAIMWRTDGEWESQWNMFGINKNGSFARIILTQVRTEYFKFDHSLFVAATKEAVRMHCTPQRTNRWTKWDARKKKTSKNNSTTFFDIRKEFYLWYHLSQSPPKALRKATKSHAYTNENELYSKQFICDRCWKEMYCLMHLVDC